MKTINNINSIQIKEGYKTRLLIPIIVVFIFLFSLSVKAQGFWINTAGGQGMDEVLDMANDANGNIYAVGYFTGVCSLQTNPAIVLTSNGADDIFIAKYSSSGTLLWAQKAGGALADKAYAVAVTPQGECYVTGFFNGVAQFGTISVTAINNSQDVFIAKYSASGQAIWVKTGGGSGIDISSGIAVDANGNCVITGQVINSGSFSSLTFSTQLHPVTNQHTYDIFIARYDSSGNIQWLKNGIGPYTDRGMAVALDNNSNAYVVLQFSDTISFTNTYNNAIYNAIGLLKLDNLGNEIWLRKAGGANMQIAYNIYITSASELLLTGDFKGNLMFFGNSNTLLNGVNTYNLFVAKYNLNGDLIWAKANGSSNKLTSRSITSDAQQNVYVSGHFECKMDDFAFVYGNATFNSVGFNDIYVVKYSLTGDFVWARHIGGKSQDYGNAIVLNNIDRPILGGSFRSRINIPISGFNFSQHVFSQAQAINCTDNEYHKYIQRNSNGVSDLFVGDIIDLNRLPYDYYAQNIFSCSPNPVKGCLASMSTINYQANLCWGGVDNVCAPDTINACDSIVIYAATHTSMLGSACGGLGPNFKYYWSTGDSLKRALKIYQSGLYNVSAITEDGCFSFDDSIYVNINPTPHITVSDDYPIQTHSPISYGFQICGPDTIMLSGSNFANSSVNWTGTGLPSIGINDSVIYINSSGVYTFNTLTPAGCANNKTITAVIDTAPPILAPVVPIIQFNHSSLNNDTITICQNQTFSVTVIDSLTGSCVPYIGSYQMNVNNFMYNTVQASPPSSCTFINQSAPQSGWRVYQFLITQIHANACGVDSAIYYVVDSIYVIVNPLPFANVSLSGNSLLCPGDTNTFNATGTGNYSWTGPGIVHMTGDSIAHIVSAGNYSVTTHTIDSITGCTNSQTVIFIVTLKQALLSSLPSDGLICPNDSVQLIAPPGLTYDWYGPLGYFATTTNNSIYVNAPGFYHVVMVDSSGCELVSNMFEVKQYATPDLMILPQAHVCPGETVSLEVTYSVGSIVTWNSPLSGNSNMQQVTQPGLYTCSVLSCGITTNLSATITHSQPIATITPSGTVNMCQGDTIILLANTGMIAYEWLPNGETAPFIEVTSAGTYSVKTTNMDGCDTLSAPVVIIVDTFPVPLVNDTTICYGTSVTLSASSIGNIEWYNAANGGLLIGVGATITIGPIFNDTTIYALAYDTCYSSRVPVNVYIDTLSLSPVINVNSTICVGGTLTFTTPTVNNASYQWTGPNGFIANTDSFTIVNVSLQDSGIYSLIVMANGCISNIASTSINVYTNMPAPLISSNSSICEGDSLMLFATGAGNGALYYWNGPNGINFNTNNVVLANAQLFQSGYYYAYYTSGGCTSLVDSLNFIIHPIPQIYSISTNAPLCEGDTLLFFANTSSGVNYNWTGTQSFQSNTQNPIIYNVTLNNSGTYNLYIEANGCSSSVASINVLVNSLPNIQISGNTNLCEGANLLLNVNNNPSIDWYYGSNSIGSSNTLQIANISSSQSGYYTVFVSNGNCSNSDSVLVNVTATPATPIVNHNSPLCSGDTLILLPDTITNASYYWYFNGNIFTTQQNIIIPNADSTYTGVYTLYYEVNGCYGDTVSIPVVVLPSTGSLFPYQTFNVCNGDSLSLSLNCLSTISYQWTGPNGFSSNQCNPFNNQVFNSTQSGVYYLTATLGTCSNGVDSLMLLVHNYPVVNLGNDTIICEGDILQLNPGTYNYYYWNTGDTTSYINVADSGFYIIHVANNYSCWSSDTIFVSTEDCSLQQVANIFTPNGDGMNDFFKITGKEIEEIDVEIFDRWGAKIYYWKNIDGYWDGKSMQTNREVPDGVYYYTAVIKTKSNMVKTLSGFLQLSR
jgi:gliding motility-associated-like protein